MCRLVLFISLLLICGCNADQKIGISECGVTGQLTLDGLPVSHAKVIFVPQQIRLEGSYTKIASGLTDEQGNFVLETDAEDSKQIQHGRYRVIVSKSVDGKELFHESYNTESVLTVEVNSQETVQQPKLELRASGSL